jgi:hypothetical protein
VRRAWLALALLLALPAPVAAAADPLWGVRAVASGSYALDYGDDGDEIDGQGTGTWRWEMKALAEGLEVDTGTAIFRMSVEESSDIVLGGQTPHCRPSASGSVGWVRDARAGLYLSTGRRTGNGFQVNHPFFDLVEGCHAGAHGMSLYDGAAAGETRVPRGTFRPSRARLFKRTWTQTISLDGTHESGTPHAFRADGVITIRAKRLSRRAARALEGPHRAVPRAPR